MKFFNTFFAETESLWSQGPVTRDFRKSYSIRPRYSTFKHFRVCSGCNKIISSYAQRQSAIKSSLALTGLRLRLRLRLHLRLHIQYADADGVRRAS